MTCWGFAMKNRRFDEEVFAAAAETVEILALMSLVPREESLGSGQSNRSAHVDFTGPCEGSLVISISESLLPELAGNMLGEDDASECTMDQQNDALKELANVICGNILPNVGGAEAIFHVGAPLLPVPDESADERPGSESVGQAELFLDQGMLRVDLYIKEESVV